MNANELRVTNFVKYGPTNYPVIMIGFDAVMLASKDGKTFQANLKDIEPIPLTEEWLLKFGLKAESTKGIASFSEEVEDGDTFWWETKIKRSEITDGFNFCIVRWGDNGEFTFSYQDLRVRIKYVHTLQNIFHSITGKELTIKP